MRRAARAPASRNTRPGRRRPVVSPLNRLQSSAEPARTNGRCCTGTYALGVKASKLGIGGYISSSLYPRDGSPTPHSPLHITSLRMTRISEGRQGRTRLACPARYDSWMARIVPGRCMVADTCLRVARRGSRRSCFLGPSTRRPLRWRCWR